MCVRALNGVVASLSAKRRAGFRKYAHDLRNWNAGISVGQTLAVSDVRSLLGSTQSSLTSSLSGVRGGVLDSYSLHCPPGFHAAVIHV